MTGIAWYLAFDEPMLPVSPKNALFSAHLASCDCEVSSHINSVGLLGLPDMIRWGLVDRDAALRNYRNRLIEAKDRAMRNGYKDENDNESVSGIMLF